MLRHQVHLERQALQKQINMLLARKAELPKGKLICIRTGKYYKWYQYYEGKRIYISKKNKELAEALAEKTYIICLLEDLIVKLNALDSYLEGYAEGPGKAEQFLLDHPEHQRLLTSYFSKKAPQILEWMRASYPTNPYHPEQLVHKTAAGHMVRSKSESMIVMMLQKYKIPYRYECELKLGNQTVYPDFMIMHPKTGEIYYWEHFGCMDDPEYVKKTVHKIQLYSLNGILPSVHLITTYENKKYPLSSEMIEDIIKYYFL